MSWDENLTGAERRDWDKFVRNAREGTAKKMMESAFVASLVPDASDEPDIKFAVELGLAIMLGKPIVAIVIPGRDVPDGLRKVADAIIYADLDTEDGQRKVAEQFREVQARLRLD